MEPLREGAEFTLYRGREHGNQTPVLAVAWPLNSRLLRVSGCSNTNTRSQPNLMRRGQLSLSRSLVVRGGRSSYLRTRGVTGLSRCSADQDRPLDLTRFLRIAIALKTLQVHGQGLIHKDINLRMRVDGDDNVWLTRFSDCSQLPHERPGARSAGDYRRTCPRYMAPEQTSGMNRSIDTRSDLYFLGVPSCTKCLLRAIFGCRPHGVGPLPYRPESRCRQASVLKTIPATVRPSS